MAPVRPAGKPPSECAFLIEAGVPPGSWSSVGGLNDVHITTDGRTLEVTSSDTRAEVELGEWASGPTVFSLRTGGVGNLRVTSIGLDD